MRELTFYKATKYLIRQNTKHKILNRIIKILIFLIWKIKLNKSKFIFYSLQLFKGIFFTEKKKFAVSRYNWNFNWLNLFSDKKYFFF